MLAGTCQFVFTTPPPPQYLCFFWMWKLCRRNLNLSCFSIKEDRKSKAIEVKLNALFKNTRSNSELVQKQWTLKHKKRIDQKSQTTSFCFLRGPLRSDDEKAPILQILIDVAGKPKIQRHRRSRVIRNSWKVENENVENVKVIHLGGYLWPYYDERHITSFVWLMKTHHQLTYVTYVPRDFIVRKTGTLLIFDNLLVWVLKCTSFLKAAHSHNYQDRYAK